MKKIFTLLVSIVFGTAIAAPIVSATPAGMALKDREGNLRFIQNVDPAEPKVAQAIQVLRACNINFGSNGSVMDLVLEAQAATIAVEAINCQQWRQEGGDVFTRLGNNSEWKKAFTLKVINDVKLEGDHLWWYSANGWVDKGPIPMIGWTRVERLEQCQGRGGSISSDARGWVCDGLPGTTTVVQQPATPVSTQPVIPAVTCPAPYDSVLHLDQGWAICYKEEPTAKQGARRAALWNPEKDILIPDSDGSRIDFNCELNRGLFTDDASWYRAFSTTGVYAKVTTSAEHGGLQLGIVQVKNINGKIVFTRVRK